MNNFYLIVEGRQTEPKILRGWLPRLLPHHTEVRQIEQITQNNYFMVSGGGYPSHQQRVQNAIKDIRNFPNTFSWLLVFVDAEEIGREGVRY